jgi:hypothetical protein
MSLDRRLENQSSAPHCLGIIEVLALSKDEHPDPSPAEAKQSAARGASGKLMTMEVAR